MLRLCSAKWMAARNCGGSDDTRLELKMLPKGMSPGNLHWQSRESGARPGDALEGRHRESRHYAGEGRVACRLRLETSSRWETARPVDEGPRPGGPEGQCW